MRSHGMRSHWGNRIGLGLLGTMLTAMGFVALWLGGSQPAEPVLDPRILVFLVTRDWALPLIAALAMLGALIATRWLMLAAGWRRRGRRTGSGTAMLGVGLKGLDGVSEMQVRQVGEERLRISITCDPDTDLGSLVSRLDGETVTRVRRAVGLWEVPTLVRLHVRRRPVSRP